MLFMFDRQKPLQFKIQNQIIGINIEVEHKMIRPVFKCSVHLGRKEMCQKTWSVEGPGRAWSSDVNCISPAPAGVGGGERK